MKFALFLCLAFAIAVESFGGTGETYNVLEDVDEPDVDITTEASFISLSVSFVPVGTCPCLFLSGLKFCLNKIKCLDIHSYFTRFERTD